VFGRNGAGGDSVTHQPEDRCLELLPELAGQKARHDLPL
jgi:hypothetical protein